jgi:hypothetical protein
MCQYMQREAVKHSAGPISNGALYPWGVAAQRETLVSASLAIRTAYRPIRIHTNIKPCAREEECRATPQDCQALVSPSPQFVRQFGRSVKSASQFIHLSKAISCPQLLYPEQRRKSAISRQSCLSTKPSHCKVAYSSIKYLSLPHGLPPRHS